MFCFKGDNILLLGSTLSPWKLEASLLDLDENPQDELFGNTTIGYYNGTFKFKDIYVSEAGNYSLKFQVIWPESASEFLEHSAVFSVDPAPPTTEEPTTVAFVPVAEAQIEEKDPE